MTVSIPPRIVTAEQWKRLKRWSHRKPVFALMGEFSAGKSTLLNFLLKKETLPTQVTATQLPPIWFSWGNKPSYVQNLDGSRETIELSKIGEVGVQGAHFVRVYLEADILEAVDLIDTPGISDPKISSDVWQRAVGQANGVLWCTHSTQAWRETERATWASLPKRLRQNSLLLVTRADALNETDQAKVLRRINREAGEMFRRTIMISARDAILARDSEEHSDLWAGSGGGKLVDNFLTITADIMSARADMLARYQKDGTSAETGTDALQLGEETSTRIWSPPVMSLSDDAGTEPTAGGAGNVVSIRPARPRRGVRASDVSETRQRIDADEAEMLRARVQSDAHKEQDMQDLKSVFHVSEEPDADADDEMPEALVLVDKASELQGDTDADTSSEWDEIEAAQIEEEHVEAQSDLAADETPEPTQDVEDEDASHLVSSVAELVSDRGQSDAVNADDADQPLAAEPISLASNQPVYSLLDSKPLSASEAWAEHLSTLGDIDDPAALHDEFDKFLKLFDDRARDHHAQQSEGALQSLSDTATDSDTVWHVL
ncbi:GTPase Era [Aliiroseovarius pelagivivens]|uniref:GTPase Era n=1 Tax=Aliiroseovarius pelagivivens TaxID=1639690 RepID=A0A2R8ATB3_9RHOB|nr:dynamin family protein [Aliiroseovarius pelagivivens]SPF79230.1 GTPase Era [Aliiroseovarius pelagivivens]